MSAEEKKAAQTAQKKATNYEMFCEAYAAMGPPMPSDKRRSNRIWQREFEKMSSKSLTKPAVRESEESIEMEQQLALETRSQYTLKHLHRQLKPQCAITSPECVCKKWGSNFSHSPYCKAIDISY